MSRVYVARHLIDISERLDWLNFLDLGSVSKCSASNSSNEITLLLLLLLLSPLLLLLFSLANYLPSCTARPNQCKHANAHPNSHINRAQQTRKRLAVRPVRTCL
eukprot:m.148717 g.148717  ORF g.148717 m.148717 type:complete len:104 (-) comp52752_c0_seq1:2280-2591(-)